MLHAHAKLEDFGPADDLWDAFELDDDGVEPEPEYGDFWGELDDDCDNAS